MHPRPPVSALTPCQSSSAVVPAERGADCPATYGFNPFLMQVIYLKYQTALVLPQKLRVFHSQSALTAHQMIWIMNALFANMLSDHTAMIAFGEPIGKFYAQTVTFFHSNFSESEGLTHMGGDQSVCTAYLLGNGNNVLQSPGTVLTDM